MNRNMKEEKSSDEYTCSNDEKSSLFIRREHLP